MEAMEVMRMTIAKMCFGIEVTEFPNRLCVGCEGQRAVKDDTKILWSDQLEGKILFIGMY